MDEISPKIRENKIVDFEDEQGDGDNGYDTSDKSSSNDCVNHIDSERENDWELNKLGQDEKHFSVIVDINEHMIHDATC